MADAFDAREIAGQAAYAAFVATLWVRERLGKSISDKELLAAIELLRNAHPTPPSQSPFHAQLLAMLGQSAEETRQ